MAEQDYLEELQRYRADSEADRRALATGLANLSSVVVRMDARLENISKLIDGNGREPLGERVSNIEREMSQQQRMTSEIHVSLRVVDEIRTTLALLVSDRDKRDRFVTMFWGSVISALVTGGGAAIMVYIKLFTK